MKSIAGLFAALVHFALSIFCLGLGLLGWIEGGEMHVPLLPVQVDHAAVALALVGALGVCASVLAISRPGGRNVLLVLWSLGVTWVLVSAIFRSSYTFEDLDGFAAHVAAAGAALLLLVASWWRFRDSPHSRSRPR